MKRSKSETGNSGEEIAQEVSLLKVPDWHLEPGDPLTEFGMNIRDFEVQESAETVPVPDEISDLTKKLEDRQTSTFYRGKFASVDELRAEGDVVRISTRETDSFSYVAASYFYGKSGEQDKNPIRPLAVQASVFSPGGKTLIIERRAKNLTDMPDKLNVFGGALRPGEIDLRKAMAARLKNKWGADIPEKDLIPTGVGRENVNNIICPFFTVELSSETYAERKKWARGEMRGGNKMFYEVSMERPLESIRKLYLGKRDINTWEPLSFYNVLYAMVTRGLITTEEVKKLLEEVKEEEKKRPMQYAYPMEKYLD